MWGDSGARKMVFRAFMVLVFGDTIMETAKGAFVS